MATGGLIDPEGLDVGARIPCHPADSEYSSTRPSTQVTSTLTLETPPSKGA